MENWVFGSRSPRIGESLKLFDFLSCHFFSLDWKKIIPSKRVRVWTLLRRNTTYSLCVAKSPSSLTSFCSASYFPANDSFSLVSLSTLPYFLFLLHFFQFPVFSALFFQNSLEHALSRSLLQRAPCHIPLPFSPIYFLLAHDARPLDLTLRWWGFQPHAHPDYASFRIDARNQCSPGALWEHSDAPATHMQCVIRGTDVKAQGTWSPSTILVASYDIHG